MDKNLMDINITNEKSEICKEFLNQLSEQENENLNEIEQLIDKTEFNIQTIKFCKQQESIDTNHNLFSPSMFQMNQSYLEAQEKIRTSITKEESDIDKYLKTKIHIEDRMKEIKGVQDYIEYLEHTVTQLKETSNPFEYDNSNSAILLNSNFPKKKYIDHMGLKLLETQESERKRIARDLHDSSIQNLIMIIHKAELCFKLSEIDSVRMKLEMQTLIQSIKSTIEDMRNIIYDLRPMSIDDLGLIVTVNRFIKCITDSSNINIKLEVNVEEVNLLPVINLTLFRIIQEACHNTLKHARAKNININIFVNEKSLELVIRDDGIGFIKEDQINREGESIYGVGLSIMKERVYLLSGTIDIITEKNIGTSILVKIEL